MALCPPCRTSSAAVTMPTHYYTLAFADGFTASTAVTADKTVAAILTDNEYFEIASADDWKAFCDLVNGGQTSVDAKMTNDIDLGSNIWQVGSNDHKYSGMFDGDGHSITVDWNSTTCDLALFYQINGATIRNLHTRGSITTTHYFGSLSGMVWQADGNVALSSCSSMVNLTLAGTGNYRSAGLIGSLSSGASATLTDCIVGGQFSGVEGNARDCWSGFVFSESDASSTLTNCLYIGNNNGKTWCRTFVYKKNISLNNCYYLNACGYDEVQGTQVTEKQLKNGYVTKLLQADRTDQCYWAQQLGEMPSLYDESKVGNKNYVYYNYNEDMKGWMCSRFEPTGYLPVGLEFSSYNFSFNRSFTGGKAYTVTLPYFWKKISSTEDKVYTLSGVDGNIARFSEVAHSDEKGRMLSFEAYHPYLVIPQGDVESVTDNHVWIQPEPETPKSIVLDGADNIRWCATYTGMSNAEAVATDAYILQSDGQFHKVTVGDDAVNIPPYRAYLTLSETREAKPLALVLEGETTDIRTIETTDRDGTVRYYNMQGRYIGTSLDGQPKGVYIKDGKKIYNSK